MSAAPSARSTAPTDLSTCVAAHWWKLSAIWMYADSERPLSCLWVQPNFSNPSFESARLDVSSRSSTASVPAGSNAQAKRVSRSTDAGA
eukprot:3318253-Amphidinium_carterae.1